MKYEITNQNILKIKADILVLGLFKGSKFKGSAKLVDDRLGNALKTLAEEEKFDGDKGKSIYLSATFGRISAKRIILLGLGEESAFSAHVQRDAGKTVGKKAATVCSSICLSKELVDGVKDIGPFVEGLILGSYEFDKYKSAESAGNKIAKLIIASSKIKDDAVSKQIERAQVLSDSINFVRDLVNEPPVYLTPTRLADIAEEVAQEGNLDCNIFGLDEIEKRGMGGLMAVSRGSNEPPRFIHLTYTPKKKPKKYLAIVGKGITFDSGGLCIKPANSMLTMKMDMAGSAVVLGAMKAISKLLPNIGVHGLISASENMTGSKAYKPDDVIKAYNGKTIEVINTDAEGRIVLSDALSYAVELKAAEIVDLATLTGACMVGLGSYTAGVMGNDKKVIDKINRAAERAGEKVWQLPMDDELRGELKSEVADMKNAGSRWGGAITAAMFLENFVGDTPWAHIDIAGPAFSERAGALTPAGGTGFGVRTIVSYIMGT